MRDNRLRKLTIAYILRVVISRISIIKWRISKTLNIKINFDTQGKSGAKSNNHYSICSNRQNRFQIEAVIEKPAANIYIFKALICC